MEDEQRFRPGSEVNSICSLLIILSSARWGVCFCILSWVNLETEQSWEVVVQQGYTIGRSPETCPKRGGA